jgi:hypothetical protein
MQNRSSLSQVSGSRAPLPGKPWPNARCAFATMLQTVFSIAECGIYRPRECRNPSLTAPSMMPTGI